MVRDSEVVGEAARLLTVVIPALTSLGSGLRRNDQTEAEDAIFLVCLIPETEIRCDCLVLSGHGVAVWPLFLLES